MVKSIERKLQIEINYNREIASYKKLLTCHNNTLRKIPNLFRQLSDVNKWGGGCYFTGNFNITRIQS